MGQLLFPSCELFAIRLGETETITLAFSNHPLDQALFLQVKFFPRCLDIPLSRDLGVVDIDTHRGLYGEIADELLCLVRRVTQFFRWGNILIERGGLGNHLEFCFAVCKRELGSRVSGAHK